MKDSRVLVTSGGTWEEIDRVRKITNTSTGRLGSLIADAFAERGARVTYLCGETALRPLRPMDQVEVIGNVRQLGAALERLLKARSYDCVVHAMAVSDYTPRAATTAEGLAAAISAAIEAEGRMPEGDDLTTLVRDSIRGIGGEPGEKKISSSLEDMVLLMEKTPKVISRIKRLQPETVLVGFKLLVDVPQAELEQVAGGLMERNDCDFVLANDLTSITGDTHKAMLIGGGSIRHLDTKQDIARAIVECVNVKKGRKQP